ncbi:MAG: biotin transporter BioY [Pseudomonadota bacterium]
MTQTQNVVLAESLGTGQGKSRLAVDTAFVLAGVALLTLCAKVQFWLPGSPVPATLGTFGVLIVGAGYGARLGVVTLVAYLMLGAAGAAVFAGEKAGLAYLTGGTGGYLLGYVLAAGAVGALARRGWDRSIVWMALALILGNALIYVPGLLWLRGFADSWAQTLAWGITPYLLGDALKLALAALLLPSLWLLRATFSR